MKTSDMVEKAALPYENSSKDRRSSSVAHRDGANRRVTCDTNFSENGHPISEPAHGGVVTTDNWVCCDKCLKWRLLPPGKEDNLPEMWLCTMMTWLILQIGFQALQEAKDRSLIEAKVSPSMNAETNQPRSSHKHKEDHDYDGGIVIGKFFRSLL